MRVLSNVYLLVAIFASVAVAANQKPPKVADDDSQGIQQEQSDADFEAVILCVSCLYIP